MTNSTTSTSLAPLARYLLNPGAANQRVTAHLVALLISVAHVALVVLSLAGLVGAGVLVSTIWLRVRRTSAAEPDVAYEIGLPPTVDAQAAVMFWTNLHDLLHPWLRRLIYGQPHLTFEMLWQGTELRFRIWVPSTLACALVERSLRAAWPGASVERIDSPKPVGEGAVLAGGLLSLQANEALPLTTEFAIDPLRFVIGSVAGLEEHQGAVVQVLCRPVTSRRVARCRAAALATGPVGWRRVALKLLDVLSPAGHRASHTAAGASTLSAHAVTKKCSSLGWEAAVRYAVFEYRSGETAEALASLAHGLASSFSIYSGDNRLRRRRVRNVAAGVAKRRLAGAKLLSVEELAGLAHLPLDSGIPGTMRTGAGSLAPGGNIPTVGKVLGYSDSGGTRKVAIGPNDARYHMHIMGATGVGKSTLLTNLVLQDIKAKRGVVVIDPKGDLIYDIVERLDAKAFERTLLIDPAYEDILPSLSVLEGGTRNLAIENVAGIFRQVFEAHWGPRTDDVFRTACMTLALAAGTDEIASLADVPVLLSNQRRREALIKQASAVAEEASAVAGITTFWDVYDKMSESQRADLVGPLMNKLRAFLLRDCVHKAVCPSNYQIDMETVLNDGILLVRIPKGQLGDEASRLLGSLVVAKVWQAAMARSKLAAKARANASLYVDECQNFMNLPRSFDEILAEARGYGLSLVLAHQHLGQLSKQLRDAIGANACNKVWFSMSPDDARVLERYVAPELSAHALGNLGRYQVALRLVVDGLEERACTAVTDAASNENRTSVTDLVASIRNRVGGEARRDVASNVANHLRKGETERREPRGHSGGQSQGHSEGQSGGQS